jgi:hypothetical protein
METIEAACPWCAWREPSETLGYGHLAATAHAASCRYPQPPGRKEWAPRRRYTSGDKSRDWSDYDD